METGLAACEALLPAGKSRFCFGDQPTLADCCLVPQIYNARRFKSDLSKVPRLVAIDEACRALPAFANAAPEAQPMRRNCRLGLRASEYPGCSGIRLIRRLSLGLGPTLRHARG